MTVAAALLREMLDVLDGDPELRERVRQLIGDRAANVTERDYLDRHAAGLGETEWRRLTREVRAFKVGRRLMVRRADFTAWIESHQVDRGHSATEPDSPAPKPDAFERALVAGELRVVRTKK